MIEKSIIVRPTTCYALILNFHYLLTIPFVLFGLILFPDLSIYIVGAGIIALLFGFYKAIYIRKTIYELTRSQLKYSRGVFSLTTDFLEVYRVKDISQQQPFLLRVIGAMNLIIQSSDKTHPFLVIKGIPLSNLADTLREVVELAREKNRVFEVD